MYKIVATILILLIGIIVLVGLIPYISASSDDLKNDPIKIPVLLYHHIDPNSNQNSIITQEKFNDDIKALVKEGYNSVSIDDIYNYLNGEGILPNKPILITFDDGYESFYKYAYPILKNYNYKASLFIIGWSINQKTFLESNIKITPHSSWAQLSEMYKSNLIEIQNHTYDLHNTKGISYGYGVVVNNGVLPLEKESYNKYEYRLLSDLYLLNTKLFDKLGIKNFYISYPYGLHSDLTDSIIKESTFKGSFTTESRIRYFSCLDDLYNVPRITIDMDINTEEILDMLSN